MIFGVTFMSENNFAIYCIVLLLDFGKVQIRMLSVAYRHNIDYLC